MFIEDLTKTVMMTNFPTHMLKEIFKPTLICHPKKKEEIIYKGKMKNKNLQYQSLQQCQKVIKSTPTPPNRI